VGFIAQNEGKKDTLLYAKFIADVGVRWFWSYIYDLIHNHNISLAHSVLNIIKKNVGTENL
jgi:hypothetical protein